jgi:hypothetical protein
VNKGIAFVVGVSLMNAVSMMIVIPVLPRAGALLSARYIRQQRTGMVVEPGA